MIGVTHDFGTLPYRSSAVDGAIRIGLRNIGNKVEREANRNLSGGGAPGAYPVPRRTGNLARSLGNTLGQRSVVVYDSAEYAAAVHGGFRAFGNPAAPFYPGRPFLADAADKVDPVAEIVTQLEQAL